MSLLLLEKVLVASISYCENFFGTLFLLPRVNLRKKFPFFLVLYAAINIGLIFLVGYIETITNSVVFKMAKTFINYFVVLAGFFLLSEDKKTNIFLTFSFAIIILEVERNIFSLLQSTSGTMMGLFLFGIETGNGIADVFLSILFRIVVLLPLALPFHRHLLVLDRPETSRSIALITILYSLIEIVLTQSAAYIRDENVSLMIIISLFSIFCSVLLLGVFYFLCERSQQAMQKELLQNTIRESSRHFDQFKESVDYINLISHDIKKFLPDIEQQLTQEKKAAIRKSLAIHESYQKTGNEVIDVLLFEKMMACRKKDIRLTSLIDGLSLAFIPHDYLYSLFSNILDNAIEALAQVDDEKRRIASILVRKTGHFVVIEQSNYYAGARKIEKGMLETTKAEKGHGYGMKSIRYVVSQLNGKIDTTVGKEVFNLRIVIPTPDPDDHLVQDGQEQKNNAQI